MTSDPGSRHGKAGRRGQPPRVRPRFSQVAGSIVVLSLALVGLPLVAIPAEGPGGLVSGLSDLFVGQAGLASISAVLFITAWAVWLQLAACAVVEGRYLILQCGIPPRVPVATWWQQEFVRKHMSRVIYGLVLRSAVRDGDLSPIPSRTRSHDPLAATADSARRTRTVRRGRSNPDVVSAPLLAAAVLAVVKQRRTVLAARRHVGQRPAVPQGALADVEVALRLGADQAGAEFVDRATRWLSASLAEAGRPPLLLIAARLSPRALELRTRGPRRDLPHPWIGDRSGSVWTLARDVDIPVVPYGPAPAPALVTIGSDERGVVLVDVEASGGLTTVTGESDRVRCVLSSFVVEMATSTWARETSLTMVGFAGASGLTDPRVNPCESFKDAWPDIESRLAAAHAVMRRLPGETASSVRLSGEALDAQAVRPEIIVLASPLTAGEKAALEPWLRQSTARPPLYVVAPQRSSSLSHMQARGWHFHLSENGVLSSKTLNHRVGAQALSPHAFSAVSQLVGHSDVEPMARRRSGFRAMTRSFSGADVKVLVHLFGEPMASGDVGPGSSLAVEIVAFLALRENVSIDELAASIWPFGIDDSERIAVLRRTQWWLGLDATGRPRLRIDDDMVHVSEEVQTDWTLIMAHVDGRVPMGPTALASLLRGRPTGSELNSGYSWLAKESAAHEIESVAADACVRAAEERLGVGEWRTALDIVGAGRCVSPGAQILTRMMQEASRAPSLIGSTIGEEMLERAGS